MNLPSIMTACMSTLPASVKESDGWAIVVENEAEELCALTQEEAIEVMARCAPVEIPPKLYGDIDDLRIFAAQATVVQDALGEDPAAMVVSMEMVRVMERVVKWAKETVNR